MKRNISLVIPAKNEAGGIKRIIESAKEFVEEIILIDGHSKDKTREIAEASGAKVFGDNRKGKGAAIRDGIKEATGEIIVFIDADGSHEVGDIPRLVEPILNGEADLVIGSRTAGGSDEYKMDWENLIRQVGSNLVTLAINLRWKAELNDVENGFRAISRSAAQSIGLRANDFDIEQEMVMKALKKGLRVKNVSSHEYRRQWGESKLKTIKGWKFVWSLLREMITK